MKEPEISNKERELLEKYQVLSASAPHMFNRLAIEIVPPILFIGFWYATENVIFLIFVIFLMVVYNVQRVLSQNSNISTLSSISRKLIGKVEGKDC